ncbi:MAG: hybrid sensor histidine kinase/response regulator [Elusimicrobia bacterium]|nr:hybrid sensor histidine kinase/response regulator [Elusimicrobiota bacterium]MDE2236291.1 hybrid sensor histidine kinase/response regulator [Elusimicrobiota bacterium]MDE2424722.1 hybrid sensor histidine kinase/response regulator [Elusimicrobiota bacterium]
MEAGTILIVDDDERFLKTAAAALRGAGLEASAAGSAEQAARELVTGRFPVVLADLRLPAASGLDVLEKARSLDRWSLGILLAGQSCEAAALAAVREGGAYDYLIKPCRGLALVAAARRALEHYRLSRMLAEKTSQLERLQDQLHHRSRMLQNVSHELKNPLAVVYGYSAFLLDQGHRCKPEDVRRSVQSIHSNAERLDSLLDELSESARLQGHKIELSLEPVAAAKLCHAAVENARLEIGRRKIELGLDCDTDALVLADSQRVQQVLSNLFSNALKFTPAGGRITLSARDLEQDGSVCFTVSDTGCGIPAKDLPHLFERFYQVSETRKDHQGLGLGLEICRGLIELHGGRIWAESQQGLGSRFHFTLPLSTAQAI